MRLLGSPPTDEQLIAVEQFLLNARDSAEPVPAYRERLDDAMRCMRGLPHVRTPGDRLELMDRAKTAIDTILENLEV